MNNHSSKITDTLWTIDDLAQYLQIKTSVIKYWIQNKNIPYIKLGKHYRFDKKEIETWIEETKTKTKYGSDNLRFID